MIGDAGDPVRHAPRRRLLVNRSAAAAVLIAAAFAVSTAAAPGPIARPRPQATARAADTAAPATAAAQVERAERELVAAIAAGDMATYDRIVADDYVAYSDTGAVLTKPAIMASYRTGTRKYLALAVSDVKVRVFGDTAVFSGNTSGTRIEDGGKPVPNHVRYFRVFTKRNGQWRAVMQIVQAIAATPGKN